MIIIGTALEAQPHCNVSLGFEEKVPVWLAENNVPAVGIGIIEDGEIVYTGMFGELQNGVPAPTMELCTSLCRVGVNCQE